MLMLSNAFFGIILICILISRRTKKGANFLGTSKTFTVMMLLQSRRSSLEHSHLVPFNPTHSFDECVVEGGTHDAECVGEGGAHGASEEKRGGG